MFSLDKIVRENIKNTKPYSSARDEYKGKNGIFIDANENSLGSVTTIKYNRYPDPLQQELKEKVAVVKKVRPTQIFFGNGSDEAIDLLYRAVCRPGLDNVITMPPTYGMYEVSANINDIRVIEVPLTPDFEIQTELVLQEITPDTKLIFICSPNNPTGNSMNKASIEKIISSFSGIVVVDEAYIDFSKDKTFSLSLDQYPNLVVLQTFSKAWGLAALRLGMAFASEEIIALLNKIKPPYNINQPTQEMALEAVKKVSTKERMVAEILQERDRLFKELPKLPVVVKLFPSDANFILVKTIDGKKVYDYLIDHKIITRDRSKISLCEGCLRITVGDKDENTKLIETLSKY